MTDHTPDTLEMIVETILAIPTLIIAAYLIAGGVKEEIRRYFK